MQSLRRAALLSAAAMAIGAAPVLAQTVSYTTAGVFTGTGCSGSSCTEGTFTLSFVGNAGPNLTQKSAIKAFEELPYLDSVAAKGSPPPRPTQIINHVPTKVQSGLICRRRSWPRCCSRH